MIPKNTVYPEDRRITSGNYRNWWKRPLIWHSHPELMKALMDMCFHLNEIYGDSLEKIVLYGSYARGEETEESDVDVALIVNSANTESMHDEMIDLVVGYELEQAVTISVVPVEFEQYQEWRKVLPFYKNMDKEGIVLWHAAPTHAP